jgi:hypothetical protein
MQPSRPSATAHQALYQATVEEAAAGGGALMLKLVASASKAYYARELTAHSPYARDALISSGKLLQSKAAELCALYPKALQAAFTDSFVVKKSATLSLAEVNFDQLELMDETQVQESVAIARAQQVTVLAAEASLAKLDTLICGALGLKTVRVESNPLRPQTYVNALMHVLEQVDVPLTTRLEWMSHMSVALGPELHSLYRTLSDQLTGQGVEGAGYAMAQAPLSGGIGLPGSVSRDAVTWTPASITRMPVPVAPLAMPEVEDNALLTLGRLRQLLSGELDAQSPAGRMASFAKQFERDFESGDSVRAQAPTPDFDSTVPAAFEALEEMKQIGKVVQRLEQRKADGGVAGADLGDGSVEAIRDMLRSTASGVAQALSLEVVTLMVDNMVRNPRLLEPIQALIAGLEPSLLLLSLVDLRFFSDKRHPARELLQEIVNRSMAFSSVEAPGFDEFLSVLQQAVDSLSSATIDNAEPFERVLDALREGWRVAALDKEQARDAAVRALQHAEQRNLLAEKIARKIEAHPDSPQVPEVVIDFLCGPWAQVVAQARIVGGASAGQADKYQALISAMLWSAHPELARKNIAKLTKLVPLLLATVRDGLETIGYPNTKTSAFLEALMALHQQAFRAGLKTGGTTRLSTAAPSVARKASARVNLVEQGDPWIAPGEVKSSNFMGFEDARKSSTAPAESLTASLDELPLGSWIELLTNDRWVRTQLAWASPHGTLFLFTSSFGTSQSMTRRTRDQLVATGALRIISDTPVVDGALNAVAQIALRNSIDTTY